MKPLTIKDRETVVFVLQDEIRRSRESRYDHRLHGVLLVAQGMACRQAAQYLGDSPRAVEYWVHRFDIDGLAGLVDQERPGRPSRLNSKQLAEINQVLRKPPEESGLSANLWDGKALSEYISREFDLSLGVRQCQRMFRQLDFRLRKPRPLIAHADPDLQRKQKKTPRTDEK